MITTLDTTQVTAEHRSTTNPSQDQLQCPRPLDVCIVQIHPGPRAATVGSPLLLPPSPTMLASTAQHPSSSSSSSSSPSPSSFSRPSSHHEPPRPSRSFHPPQFAATTAYPLFIGARLVQGIEELRSVLTNHSVATANSSSSSSSVVSSSAAAAVAVPGPSVDRHRAPVPARLTADGPRPDANSTSVNSWQSAFPAFDVSAFSPSPRNADAATTTTTTSTTSTRPVRHVDSPTEESQSKRLQPAKPPVKVLPARYELADPRDVVVLISSMVMELIQFNDKIPLHQGRLTRFHSRSPPRISVQDYLQRLTTHATLSPPVLLSMVYYIDRLCALYPAFTVSSLTIHRFLIASATVASKGLSDSFWTNKTYARVGGISLAELALLELEFLFRVEWRIVPQPEVLVDYYKSLVERCGGYEIRREGDVADEDSVAPVVSETQDEAK